LITFPFEFNGKALMIVTAEGTIYFAKWLRQCSMTDAGVIVAPGRTVM
jgi:hypothetical protein